MYLLNYRLEGGSNRLCWRQRDVIKTERHA